MRRAFIIINAEKEFNQAAVCRDTALGVFLFFNGQIFNVPLMKYGNIATARVKWIHCGCCEFHSSRSETERSVTHPVPKCPTLPRTA